MKGNTILTEIARMKFRSLKNPKERGALVLQDDGTIQIEPSEALRDEMSRLEEQALRRAQIYGTGLGLGLIALGTLAVGAGWLAGRIFGKMGHSLSMPRSVEQVTLTRDEGGGVRLVMPGAESRFQTIQMGWNGDEVLLAEADTFMSKYEELRRV